MEKLFCVNGSVYRWVHKSYGKGGYRDVLYAGETRHGTQPC
jgi:hypothetical protein